MTQQFERSSGWQGQSCATLPSLASLTFEPGSYTIDTHKSLVEVSGRAFFGLARPTATFNIIGGRVIVAHQTERSWASAVINATKISYDRRVRHWRWGWRDSLVAHVNAPIQFCSTEVHQVRSLTRIGGVVDAGNQKRPVELEIVLVEPRLDDDYRVEARTIINRHDFGISNWRGVLARNLNVRILAHLTPSSGSVPNTAQWR